MSGHELSEFFITRFFDHCNAGCAVGFEDKCEYLRNEIVVFITSHRIGKFLAICAAGVAVFNIA
jgi:hypothetical protein